jgi:MFS family permease
MTNNDGNTQSTPIIFDGWRSISIALFMSLVGYTVMVSVPVLSTALVKKVGFTEVEVGRIWGQDLLGLAIGAIISAVLVAKVNRRYLVVAGIILTVGANAACMVIDSYIAMMVLRLAAGIGSGIFTGVAVATLGGATNLVLVFNLLLLGFAFSQAFELHFLPKLSMNGIYIFFIAIALMCGVFLHWLPKRPLTAEELLQQEEAEDHTDDWHVPKIMPVICLVAVCFTYINIGGYYTYVELAALTDNISKEIVDTSEGKVDINMDEVQITVEIADDGENNIDISEDKVDILEDNVHITVAQVGSTGDFSEDMVDINGNKINITVGKAQIAVNKLDNSDGMVVNSEQMLEVNIEEGKVVVAVDKVQVSVAKAKLDVAWAGHVLTLTSFLGLAGCIIAHFCKRFGLYRPLFVGLFVMTVAVGMLGVDITRTTFALSLFGFWTLWTFADVFQSAMISHMDRSGTMVALMPCVQGFGQFVGPNIAASILAYGMGYDIVFFVSGSMTMVALILYYVVYLCTHKRKAALASEAS